MSGIAGIIRFDDKPIDLIELNAMNKSLSVRGPDTSDIWHKGTCGMAHTMLWTTPESLNEKLPLVDHESGLVITSDARVDNRNELINQLGIDKSRAKTFSDSEIILLAYKKWHEDCPKKIIGDFSFAIWDIHKHKLFCARDHMGVKPFYYFYCHDFIAFASEIKALHCLTEISKDTNQTRIIDYMMFVTGAEGETFYRDIKKLPASNSLTVSRAAFNISRYFTFDSEYELNLKSDNDYVEAFKEIFTGVVKEQLRSAYPVGTALSGGLDSSSISVLSRNIHQQTTAKPIHTFSAVFPDLPAEQFKKSDERRYMDAVINQADGIIPHFINASKYGPYDDIDATMKRYDGIAPPINRYIEDAMYRAARKQEVRVMLEGYDGDTAISYGVSRLGELGHKGKILSLIKEYRLLQYRYESRFSMRSLLVDYVVKPRLSPKVIRYIQTLKGTKQHNQLAFPMLHPNIKRNINYDHAKHLMRGYDPLEYVNARTVHARGISWSAWELTHEWKDIDAATYSLEARYPFWDRRLMKFCLAIPSDQKLKNGWTRSILRRGMDGILPDIVRTRVSKGNLAPNVMKKFSELSQKDVNYFLLDKCGPLSDLVDIKSVSDAWKIFSKDPYNNKDILLQLHLLLTLSMWLNTQ